MPISASRFTSTYLSIPMANSMELNTFLCIFPLLFFGQRSHFAASEVEGQKWRGAEMRFKTIEPFVQLKRHLFLHLFQK